MQAGLCEPSSATELGPMPQFTPLPRRPPRFQASLISVNGIGGFWDERWDRCAWYPLVNQ